MTLKKKQNTEVTPVLGSDLKGGRTSWISCDGGEKLFLLPKESRRSKGWETSCAKQVFRLLAL